MLLLAKTSSPDASFIEDILYTPHIGLVRSFSYIPHASFSEEFLLHSWYQF